MLPLLEKIFEEDKPDVCIQFFAGLKAVGESVEKPLEYYQNNIAGTLNLLLVMRKYNMKNMIFLLRQPYMVIRRLCRSRREIYRRDSVPILMAGRNRC